MGALTTPITGILVDRMGKRPLVSKSKCKNDSVLIKFVYDLWFYNNDRTSTKQ